MHVYKPFETNGTNDIEDINPLNNSNGQFIIYKKSEILTLKIFIQCSYKICKKLQLK